MIITVLNQKDNAGIIIGKNKNGEIVYKEKLKAGDNNVPDDLIYYQELELNDVAANDYEISTAKAKIRELDLKRIRAIAEPSVKDSEAGETWLQYYTKEIISLRENIRELGGVE